MIETHEAEAALCGHCDLPAIEDIVVPPELVAAWGASKLLCEGHRREWIMTSDVDAPKIR